MTARFIKPATLAIAVLFSGSVYAENLNVVSSFSILGDVAQQIGGDHVTVTNLVGADQDAHAYQLTSADMKKIAGAKLVLVNGLGLEKAEIMRAVQQNKVNYAEATKGITPLKNEEGAEHHHHHHDGHGHDHDHGEFDPHVWNDPVLMQRYAANVATALIKADPANKDYYQKRFTSYSAQLKDLANYASQQFNSVPREKRKVLTGHDAFNYMGKRYGISFITPQGVSTESEPSAKTVAAIIRQIKQQGIKAVFTENIKDGRMVQQIARETGAKVGGTLYSDALSNGGNAKTYVDMYRYNVRVLTAAMK
ncbi:metal ABC transporter solute-binding protein, Zn/Mn family [Kingella negevensis]|uniref:metal ABC transporter solute-binding protein, Zn/Mn family n=1 Tax=Kingella negevensis TaxID=1522312 RepID=UPI00254B1C11|nr:zinc ABC transporter substrate-binding protein [Kingella negevensis]MDK4681334.1 zinc ABC transporter substrate-binding protein [Kingella negevensis]MDK4683531.1 zinc ABC transporter substrate-binding protein [Kingella negevensis]MDK4691334.1 zinc ABC transporter substrate-binding protein [Kingella negevensis]MDK4693517.1 zinc ABC transporter substrate-binding protein [Kingella negevensis]MDK4700130.1 zinc ABC transporter substrate-binding protein [Kingella negevensis]